MPFIMENKQARWRYHIVETWEAGIVLTGQEVKSLKTGHGDLRNAYISVRPVVRTGKRRQRFEALLVNAHIPPYAKAGPLPSYDPLRSRQLLFHGRELMAMIGKIQAAGLTLVPLRVYTLNRRLKILVGLGRGKSAVDKRATIRRRETEREMRRSTLRSVAKNRSPNP